MSNHLLADLQLKLINEEKLTLPYAAILAENALYRFEPSVREGVLLWMSGLLDSGFTVEEKSLADIQSEIGCSLFQALCVLDILVKGPERVKGAMWIIPVDRTHEAIAVNPGFELPPEAIEELC